MLKVFKHIIVYGTDLSKKIIFYFWSISFLLIDTRHAWYINQTNTFFIFDRLYGTFLIHNHYNMTNVYRDMKYSFFLTCTQFKALYRISLTYGTSLMISSIKCVDKKSCNKSFDISKVWWMYKFHSQIAFQRQFEFDIS